MSNVFRSTSNRFLYFKGSGCASISQGGRGDEGGELKLERIKVKFQDFLKRSSDDNSSFSSNADTTLSPLSSNKHSSSEEHLYLYGEPLPRSLRDRIISKRKPLV